jgi:hypothetical protein
MKRKPPKYKHPDSIALAEAGKYKGWIKSSRYAASYHIIWHFYVKNTDQIFAIAIEKPPKRETVQTWEEFFELYCMAESKSTRLSQDIDEEVQHKLNMSLCAREI